MLSKPRRPEVSRFPLAGLHPNFLERIISKFEWKIYFRLQQTCHQMSEFIRTNQKVNTCVPRGIFLGWGEDDEDDEPRVSTSITSIENHPEYLHGARFKEITLILGTDFDCERFPDEVKKYRITCEFLDFRTFTAGLREIRAPVKEEHIELVKHLKPDRLLLDSTDCDVYEAAAAWKHLKNIYIISYLGEILPALQMASQVPEITLHVTTGYGDGPYYSAEQFCDTLEALLQFLRSEPLTNPRYFRISMGSDYDLPSLDDRFKRLSNFQPIIREKTERIVCRCRLGQTLFCIILFSRGAVIELAE